MKTVVKHMNVKYVCYVLILSTLMVTGCKKQEVAKEGWKGAPAIITKSGSCQSSGIAPSANWLPGTTVLDSIYVTDPALGSRYRYFRVHIPSGYSVANHYPLVYMFHGKGQTSLRMVNKTTWNQEADLNNFIVVYPDAIASPAGVTRWKTINAATGPVAMEDDVYFFRRLNDTIGERLNVYCDSVYACGFSQGNNFIKQRLRVEANDLLAAMCGSGSIGDLDGVYVPLNGTHRPFFEVCGTIDGPALDHCSNLGVVLSNLHMLPANIDAEPCIIDRIDSLRLGMELDNIRTEVSGTHANGRGYSELIYNTSLVGQTVEYKFRMVENLSHKTPSTNNSFNPDYYSKFWTWLSQYCL